ncbi:lipoprotein insertase outer membrane protein LolB [Massilia sp. ST3]|uniref:lipoprotein insertase outer membrane protein LolB n=1 Tax=Massilia sp. ST3 TaxID=2824903 RepID=UPI001B8130BB|nr:lipoprotein insertase outer membrane protein LolB [Massilia sp. ST3]MBQ5948261.1 outer membrane lipoprotein LolB [Massilia sp. ST3]
MLITRRLSLIALAAALAGCATTGAPLSTATVGAYRETIALDGKLSVNYIKDGRQESLTGNFSWEQRPGRIDVSLASPLGQTLATIAVTPEGATLTQADRAPRTAADIDSLTQQTLGWTLPVSGLRDWLQGYALDADGKRFAASPANNSVVTKDGWRLRFVSWQDETSAQPLPRRIDAERSAADDIQDLAIRIVITPAG